MTLLAYERFRKAYQALPRDIQHKVDKQLAILAHNPRHPSLQAKRIKGVRGIWEARVDLHYRMTFEMVRETLYLRVVGHHDEVLNRP